MRVVYLKQALHFCSGCHGIAYDNHECFTCKAKIAYWCDCWPWTADRLWRKDWQSHIVFCRFIVFCSEQCAASGLVFKALTEKQYKLRVHHYNKSFELDEVLPPKFCGRYVRCNNCAGVQPFYSQSCSNKSCKATRFSCMVCQPRVTIKYDWISDKPIWYCSEACEVYATLYDNNKLTNIAERR